MESKKPRKPKPITKKVIYYADEIRKFLFGRKEK